MKTFEVILVSVVTVLFVGWIVSTIPGTGLAIEYLAGCVFSLLGRIAASLDKLAK